MTLGWSPLGKKKGTCAICTHGESSEKAWMVTIECNGAAFFKKVITSDCSFEDFFPEFC